MLPVSFAGVSFGRETASIGVSVDRSELDIDDADATFCGKRISGTLHRNRDAKGQKRLADNGEQEISATFDVKRFSVSPKKVGFKLQFNISDLEDQNLEMFAMTEGRLEISKVNELPETLRPPDAPGQKRITGTDGDTFTDHPDTGVQPKEKKPKKPKMASTTSKNALDD
jgi:hypothetical protein